VSDLRRLCGDPLSALEDPAPAVWVAERGAASTATGQAAGWWCIS